MSEIDRPIAYITAGAGGMYCGSCMHDNTLVRGLVRQGIDVQLIPTYTPIRTDEENVSVDRVFFGGINVYLEQTLPFYRYLPALFGSLLDRPWLIRWATSRPAAINASFLGGMTVSMLRGTHGNQRREVEKLCHWLKSSLDPRLVVFTNMLIAGCAERLKSELSVPLLVTLQGDDAFIEALPEPFHSQALKQIRRLVASVDGFLVHSRYYADFMRDYFEIPEEKLHLVPLGIDVAGFPAPDQVGRASTENARPPRVGYLARLSPEKGLHVLVDAFLELRKREATRDAQLHIAGWLGEDQKDFAEGQFEKLRAAGLADAFRYVGVLDRPAKLEFLQGLDLLSVPTTYRDPKGLFILEALAAGVPVVQPAHGAFPELVESLQGGRLVAPNDPRQLADQLHALLTDEPARRQLGRQGAQTVHERFNAEAMARTTWDVLQKFL